MKSPLSFGANTRLDPRRGFTAAWVAAFLGVVLILLVVLLAMFALAG